LLAQAFARIVVYLGVRYTLVVEATYSFVTVVTAQTNTH